jgi:tRNA U34 5-methylaminomethyl-2-thiouridine-forming methyltransferase MnmC
LIFCLKDTGLETLQMMSDFRIVTTDDGSHSLFSPELNESYHSRFGALNESEHIFILAGFDYLIGKSEINILEIGFGTGLNALLTYYECNQKKIVTLYEALEPFPLTMQIIKQLNYPEISGKDDASEVFNELHDIAWNQVTWLNDFFGLRKMKFRLEDFLPVKESYHLIYFDAFSPEVQAEIWTETIFRKLYDSLVDGGILVTYCAKGYVRRNMKSAGFEVERIPGPKGKREMLRAIKVLKE